MIYLELNNKYSDIDNIENLVTWLTENIGDRYYSWNWGYRTFPAKHFIVIYNKVSKADLVYFRLVFG